MQPFLQNVSSSKNYLTYQILPSNQEPSSTPELGSRPELCNDPLLTKIQPIVTLWQQHHTNHCSHDYHYLGRCGSKELDPIKNPEVWKKYIDSIETAFKEKMSKKNEINFTCFGSGLFLLNFLMIKYMCSLNEFKNWKGNLHFNFIEFKYRINKETKFKINNLFKSESSIFKVFSNILETQAIETKMCAAGTSTEGQRQLQSKSTQKENTKDTIEKEKQAFKDAMIAFSKNTSRTLYDNNQNVRLTLSFFSHQETYIKSGKNNVDIACKYDPGLDTFFNRITENMEYNGNAILMDKQGQSGQFGKDRPILRESKGKVTFIKKTFLNETNTQWESYR